MAAKILLMDSNLRLLSTTAERLTHLGYEVATASRVHDAVLKGIVVPPDLVVCDVLMPELNGWEFKRLTAQIPSLAATPVLFLSSQDGLPPEFYDPAAGLVDALKKPASSDAIAAAVAALLARQTARQRLLRHPLSGALPLTDASLVDLCHVMALRVASGVMRLTARAWSAEFTWLRGHLVDAAADGARGNEVLFAAFTIPSGDLRATLEPPPTVPPRHTVTKPLPDLLAEAVRRARALAEPERSQPGARPPTETEEEFLTRLAATGLIRRTATAAR